MRALISFITVLLLAGVVLSSCLFTVYQHDRVLISRFGKFNKNDNNEAIIYGPGLHFKLPVIDKIHNFDTRLQMLGFESSSIFTSQKKEVRVNLFVQWRIRNFEKYYTRTGANTVQGIRGRQNQAQQLLRQKVFDGLRAEFGRLTIKDVVSGERIELMARLSKHTDKSARELGMEVVDFRIKQINLPEAVSAAVYDRMRSERERVAAELRASGSAAANIIRANADKQQRIILAEAKEIAEKLRGDGDSQAVRIYAKSYEQNPKFYEFYRTLEAYKNTFRSKQDVLILRPDSEFFKFFHGAKKYS
jgi:membrane protease subunit HflC